MELQHLRTRRCALCNVLVLVLVSIELVEDTDERGNRWCWRQTISGKYESTNYQLANNSEEEWRLDEYRNHFSPVRHLIGCVLTNHKFPSARSARLCSHRWLDQADNDIPSFQLSFIPRKRLLSSDLDRRTVQPEAEIKQYKE
jgi:hypothetical protein